MSRALKLLLLLLVLAPAGYAETPWEVGVIFLGKLETDPLHQGDIDRNIRELAQSSQNPNYRLSLYLDFPKRGLAFYPDATSSKTISWGKLQYANENVPVLIPGDFDESEGEQSILREDEKLQSFLHKAFRNPRARRMLVIYGHGYAFDGLRDARILTIKRMLAENLPARAGAKPLDLLWADACFMANLESVYEWRDLASYYLASEESEFSAGAPFDEFRLFLEGPDDPAEVAKELGELYVLSYSYVKEGKQREAVIRSAATLSVIDTGKLGTLVDKLGALVEEIRPVDLSRSRKRIELRMEEGGKTYTLDLGNFLRYLKTRRPELKSDAGRDLLRDLVESLEVEREERVGRSPKFKLVAPNQGDWVVYGYNDWQNGSFADKPSHEDFPKNLAPEKWVRVGEQGQFPAHALNFYSWVSPFTPLLTKFHYFFAKDGDGRRKTSDIVTLKKTGEDYVLFTAQNEANPILFSGYTQGKGRSAEKYTGLSILDPGMDLKKEHLSPDYSYLEFAKKTRWESLTSR